MFSAKPNSMLKYHMKKRLARKDFGSWRILDHVHKPWQCQQVREALHRAYRQGFTDGWQDRACGAGAYRDLITIADIEALLAEIGLDKEILLTIRKDVR